MASKTGETLETTAFITSDPGEDPGHAEEAREPEVRSKQKPETENSELAVDHVYSQKFIIAMSQIDKFKENIGSYTDKMLNYRKKGVNYGIVFFKVQFYYDADARDGHHTCTMNFHLFSIHSIDEQKEKIIQQFVDEFLRHFPQGTVRLDSTEILIRANTQFKKPTVP